MKRNFTTFAAFSALGVLCGCVNVDKEVAETPSVFWKAPKEAMPEKEIAPEQVKTDKILGQDDDEKSSESKAASDIDTVHGASKKLSEGQILQLAELVDIALENNTQTRIYWFQAKSYAANLGKANSSYYPQISITADIYRSRTKASLPYFPNIGKYYETGYGPSAQINWLIYDFGKREAQVESAREALRAANFDYNQSVQDVVLNVNVAYYNFYTAMGNVKTAKMTIEDARTTYESANARLRDGVGNKQDMLNALANLRNAEFELEAATAQVESTRALLAQAMGIRVNSNLNIADNVSIPSGEEASNKIDDLIAQALRSRQSLLAAYANLRQSGHIVDVARRNFLPSIGAVGSASYTGYTQDDRDAQENYQIGAQLTWSIFEGFTKKYELIDAKAQERVQAQQLKATEIQIITDIWTYYHNYQSARKQILSAKAAVEANTEAYKATKVGYENGINSLTDLLNSQNRLAMARQQEVSASSDLAVSIARLAHATGNLMAVAPEEGA